MVECLAGKLAGFFMRFKDGRAYRFVKRDGDTVEVATFTKWEDGSAEICFEPSEWAFESDNGWREAVALLEQRGFVLDGREKSN
jgi:hypothetical protein